MLSFLSSMLFFFFFNDTATTEIYTLSLHDALPIYLGVVGRAEHDGHERRGIASLLGRHATQPLDPLDDVEAAARTRKPAVAIRSEEHTSELQSQSNLVCRLLLEKKKLPIASATQRL